jgi:hypothetical protein
MRSMRTTHHVPTITEMSDGRWVVICPDCESDQDAVVPIGIGTPVNSRHMAELLRANHATDPLAMRRGA